MSKKNKMIIGGVLGIIIGLIGITFIFNATQKPKRIDELMTLMEVKYDDYGIHYNEDSDIITVNDVVVKWDGSTVEQEILHKEITDLMKEKGIRGTECWVIIDDIWKVSTDEDYGKFVVITDDGIEVKEFVPVEE